MAKTTVLRGQLILKENSLTEVAGNRILTYDSTTGEITSRPAIAASGTFVSSTLPSAQIIVGNGSNVATAVAMTGDVTISNAGVTAIGAGVIVNADVSGSAAIAYSKLALTGSIVNADVSGSAAIAYSKLNLTGAVVNADIGAAAAIARTKIASGTAYRLVANNASGVMSENAALTASRALVSDANGQPVAATTTTTEINYVSGVTSAIQTQLNTLITGKATNALIQSPTAAEDGFAITWDDGAQEWNLTDPVIQGIPTGGSTRQFLGKNSGTNYDASWLTLATTDITDITATAAELNILDGATLTVTELNYVDGVTSNIQSQLDAKQSSSLAFNALWVGNGSGIATQLPPGTSGYILTSVGGAPQWAPNAGGIGGSTGSTDNVVLRANGTGGATVQAGSLWAISDFGNVTIGSGSAITQYYIDTDGSANEVDLRLRAKRTSASAGFTQFYVNGSSDSFGMTNGTELCDIVLSSGLVHMASADALEIEAQNGDFLLKSYDHIFLQPSDGGTIGNIGLCTSSVANWQSMDGGVFIANAAVVPSGNPSGGGFLYVEGGALKYRGSSGTITTVGPA